MKIRLPETFIYTNRAKNSSAYVKNGILYVKGYMPILKDVKHLSLKRPTENCILT